MLDFVRLKKNMVDESKDRNYCLSNIVDSFPHKLEAKVHEQGFVCHFWTGEWRWRLSSLTLSFWKGTGSQCQWTSFVFADGPGRFLSPPWRETVGMSSLPFRGFSLALWLTNHPAQFQTFPNILRGKMLLIGYLVSIQKVSVPLINYFRFSRCSKTSCELLQKTFWWLNNIFLDICILIFQLLLWNTVLSDWLRDSCINYKYWYLLFLHKFQLFYPGMYFFLNVSVVS